MLGSLRLFLVRMFASVLLVTISVHAAAPAGGMEQDRGSAFCAATADVAIMTPARQLGKLASPQPEPEGPEPHCEGTATPSTPLAVRQVLAREPWSQGPPPKALAKRLGQPRAPPLD